MENTAFYRKYRPEAFDEIIGQDHIVATLESSLKNNKIAHAYLFSGSRGTGKTTMARIVAKALGTSSNDIYEIDAASNNGVDDIRELRENVGTNPFDSKYKVYIVDEVHMLSKAAFNALLKTLEEPPAHVVFILATTELDKVPETIISRCQTFIFQRPNEATLRTLIERTAKKEKLNLEAGVAELIAILADGAFRDALGVLQKVASTGESKITLSYVEKITGAPSTAIIRDILESIARGSLAESLAVLEKAKTSNISPKLILDLLLHSFRRILLLKVAPQIAKEELDGLGEDEQEFALRLSKMESLHLTSQNLLLLLEAGTRQKYALIQSLPLELALLKMFEK